MDAPPVPRGGTRGVSGSLLASALVFIAVAVREPRRPQVLRRLGMHHGTQPRLLAWLRTLGRQLGPLLGAEPADDQLVGVAALVAAVSTLPYGLAGPLVVLASAALMVRARRQARRRARERQIERGLPEVVELLGLVIGAGRPTAAALSDIAPRSPEPFRSELAAVTRRAAAGEPFVESFARLRTRLGPSLGALIGAVTAAEIDGVPLQPALERVADEAHRRRRVRAEEAARRVPVLMLFPLVFCILPAFCLLTIVPLVVSSMPDLSLGG